MDFSMTVHVVKLKGELDAALIPYDSGIGLAGVTLQNKILYADSVTRIDFLPETSQAVKDQAWAIVAAHSPTDTNLTNEQAAKADFDSVLSDATTAKNKAKAYYDGLSGAQKLAIMNTLDNWGSATTGDKINALLGLVALLYMAVWWLYMREKQRE